MLLEHNKCYKAVAAPRQTGRSCRGQAESAKSLLLLHHPNKQRGCIGSAQCIWLEKLKASHGLRSSSRTPQKKSGQQSQPVQRCTQQGTQATQSAGIVARLLQQLQDTNNTPKQTMATLPDHAHSMQHAPAAQEHIPPTRTQWTLHPRCVLLAAAATTKPRGIWLCHKPLSVAAAAPNVHAWRLSMSTYTHPNPAMPSDKPSVHRRYPWGVPPGRCIHLVVHGSVISQLAAQVSCTNALPTQGCAALSALSTGHYCKTAQTDCVCVFNES